MAVASRFASLTASDIDDLVESKDSVSTKKATRAAVDLFRKYLVNKNMQEDFLSSSNEELNDILEKFYVEVRKIDGTDYSKSSLVAFRFAPCRYNTESESARGGRDIHGPSFYSVYFKKKWRSHHSIL